MSEVSGIELEKDAAGNNSYVRIDLKKYGDMINPILQRLGVNLSDSNLDEFERDWNKGLSIEEFMTEQRSQVLLVSLFSLMLLQHFVKQDLTTSH